jgi:hypothetical protein
MVLVERNENGDLVLAREEREVLRRAPEREQTPAPPPSIDVSAMLAKLEEGRVKNAGKRV